MVPEMITQVLGMGHANRKPLAAPYDFPLMMSGTSR